MSAKHIGDYNGWRIPDLKLSNIRGQAKGRRSSSTVRNAHSWFLVLFSAVGPLILFPPIKHWTLTKLLTKLRAGPL